MLLSPHCRCCCRRAAAAAAANHTAAAAAAHAAAAAAAHAAAAAADHATAVAAANAATAAAAKLSHQSCAPAPQRPQGPPDLASVPPKPPKAHLHTTLLCAAAAMATPRFERRLVCHANTTLDTLITLNTLITLITLSTRGPSCWLADPPRDAGPPPSSRAGSCALAERRCVASRCRRHRRTRHRRSVVGGCAGRGARFPPRAKCEPTGDASCEHAHGQCQQP
eukprot:44349-Chlamydomonas_euryale.AAC.5